jgi:hypothetical protein
LRAFLILVAAGALLALGAQRALCQKKGGHPSAPKVSAPKAPAHHAPAPHQPAAHAPTPPKPSAQHLSAPNAHQVLKPSTMVARPMPSTSRKPTGTTARTTPKPSSTSVPAGAVAVQNVFRETIVVPSTYGGYHRSYRYGGRSYYGYRRGYSRFGRYGPSYANSAQALLAMRRLEQLRLDIDRIRSSKSLPSATMQSQLQADLLAIVRVPARSATPDVTRLADHLATALPGHPGPVPDSAVLVTDLDRVLNGMRLSPADVEGSIVDAGQVLRAWRVPMLRVASISSDLRAIGGVGPGRVATRLSP